MNKLITGILFFLLAIGHAQDSDQLKKIKNISKQACECIAEIDVNKTKQEKSEDIKTCIHSANLGYQIDADFLTSVQKTIDSLSVDDKIKSDSLVIQDKKNFEINISENYEEIEAYLYENCSSLKSIYFTNNDTTKNSYSKRKKAMAFYEKGQIAFAKQEYSNAIVMFNKAVKKDKNFAFAWDNLGFSYRKVNNYEAAITCYKKSLAIDPTGKMPLMNLAVAYSLNEDLPNALEAYENYKSIYNDDPEGYYGIGRILYMQKNYEHALENMITAYYLYRDMESPYNIDAQKHIGFIYNDMKELGQLDVFDRIAKENNLQVNTED
ncbi:MAG: tetratricopeptide repeat protein [Psychroserpens sp.]|uniref:tetratricopeptide repeat protein n=1 Tax=Psychroserpens sp. TaxID=2020870 RepID=UPI003C74961A